MRGDRRTPERGREAGFTLVELLIAVTILGVIALALGNVVIGYITHADDTADRLALSHDAQISAAHFARDVAVVGRRDTAGGTGADAWPFLPSIEEGGRACGDPAMPAAVVTLRSDRWDGSGSTPSGTDTVAYYVDGSELHRVVCGSPATDAVLAHHVDPTTVKLTCSSTCNAAAVPATVTLSFTVSSPAAGQLPIILTGQRRQTS